MADVMANINPPGRTTAPRQSMPSALYLQIEDFTGSLFDTEATHYGYHTSDLDVLSAWLTNLAAEVSGLAEMQAADERLNFHLPPEQRKSVIAATLKDRIEYWVEQKKTELERKAKGPLIEPSPPPMRSRNVLAPQTSMETVNERVNDAMRSAPKPHHKTIRERLDDLALDIGHDALAAKIGIPRSSYYNVKAGGGKTTRKKVERYLSELDSTDPKD
jgi:hypothetical protein